MNITIKSINSLFTEWIAKYNSLSKPDDKLLKGTFKPNDSEQIPVMLDTQDFLDLIYLSELIEKAKRTKGYNLDELNKARHHFHGAKLDGIEYYNLDLNMLDLLGEKTSLAGASFIGSIIINSDLSNCFCAGTDFSYSDFTNTDLSNASFSSTNLTNTCFINAMVNNLYYIPTSELAEITANFYGSNFHQIRTSPNTMSELEYNIEEPQKHLNETIFPRLKKWTEERIYFNNINLKSDIYYKKIPGANSYDSSDCKLNKNVYEMMLKLSYNISRADNIIDRNKSDKKKHDLIKNFNDQIEKLYPINDCEYRTTKLLIQDADLSACCFDANYKTPSYKSTGMKCSFADFNFDYSYIENSSFNNCHLQRASFNFANIENSSFNNCELRKAKFNNATNLNRVTFIDSNLEVSEFKESSITGISLTNSQLDSANFEYTHINTSDFSNTNCRNVLFTDENLVNCNFSNMFYEPSQYSDFFKMKFLHSNIDVANIPNELNSLIQYNRRKDNWEKYYNSTNNILEFIIRQFWKMTDYGYSTTSIVKYFILISIFFATIYTVSHLCGYELLDVKTTNECQSSNIIMIILNHCFINFQVFIKSLYFSVVTMTTLGFGDIVVKNGNILGYIIVMFQVILGYITLGALITRFGILFTSQGPTITPKDYTSSRFNHDKLNTNIVPKSNNSN